MSKILEQFVGEKVVVFVSGIMTASQNEEGHVEEIPMMLSGILFDMDDRYVLLGNEEKTSFSLLNHDAIMRIDSGEDTSEALEKPDASTLN